MKPFLHCAIAFSRRRRQESTPTAVFVILLCFQVVLSLLPEGPPQEGDDLATGAGVIGREGGVAGSLGDTLLQRPVHRVGADVREVGGRSLGAAGLFPHELHRHLTGAGVVGAKLISAGHALLSSPGHSLLIVSARIDVRKGASALGFRGTGGPPQEGDDLGTGAGVIGAERRVRGAVGDALFHRPGNGVPVIGGLRHVGELDLPLDNGLLDDRRLLLQHQLGSVGLRLAVVVGHHAVEDGLVIIAERIGNEQRGAVGAHLPGGSGDGAGGVADSVPLVVQRRGAGGLQGKAGGAALGDGGVHRLFRDRGRGVHRDPVIIFGVFRDQGQLRLVGGGGGAGDRHLAVDAARLIAVQGQGGAVLTHFLGAATLRPEIPLVVQFPGMLSGHGEGGGAVLGYLGVLGLLGDGGVIDHDGTVAAGSVAGLGGVLPPVKGHGAGIRHVDGVGHGGAVEGDGAGVLVQGCAPSAQDLGGGEDIAAVGGQDDAQVVLAALFELGAAAFVGSAVAVAVPPPVAVLHGDAGGDGDVSVRLVAHDGLHQALNGDGVHVRQVHSAGGGDKGQGHHQCQDQAQQSFHVFHTLSSVSK